MIPGRKRFGQGLRFGKTCRARASALLARCSPPGRSSVLCADDVPRGDVLLHEETCNSRVRVVERLKTVQKKYQKKEGLDLDLDMVFKKVVFGIGGTTITLQLCV